MLLQPWREIMEDFEEIAHCGGRIEVFRDGSVGWSGETTSRVALHLIYVLPGGIPLAVVRISGGSVLVDKKGGHQPFLGTLRVLIASDKEGYFGRKCPGCNEYFRSWRVPPYPEVIHCPYCGSVGGSAGFLTDNQKAYVTALVQEELRALDAQEDTVIDLDRIAENLQNNRSPFYYSEQRQQTQVECDKDNCRNRYDIFGLFGFCPVCGRRNTFQYLRNQLDLLEDRVDNPRFDESDRQNRENEWRDVIKSSVSEFEIFANDLLSQLLTIPAVPRRKQRIQRISFHNPISAGEELKNLFEIELFRGISEDDKHFIHLYFQRRHILEHRGGIADDEYITKSGDTSVKVGQRVRIRSSNAENLLTLIREMSNNLFTEWESIS